MSDKRIIIAIDGPAGAGKSTLAQRLADRLGFVYINSGAMYRAVALWALRNKTDLQDMHRLETLACEAKIEFGIGDRQDLFERRRRDGGHHQPDVSMAASKVSAVPGVRRAFVPLQRGLAEKYSVVMEGRDIGTVIFPDAQVKIFLDADPQERARRRAFELKERGRGEDIEAVADAIRERDQRDRTRQEAPLIQAPDAQLIDTTKLSVEEAEESILRLVRSRTSNGKEVSR